jgi:hypothetical protein
MRMLGGMVTSETLQLNQTVVVRFVVKRWSRHVDNAKRQQQGGGMKPGVGVNVAVNVGNKTCVPTVARMVM